MVGHAQIRSTITPDGTLGTAVTPRGTLFDITGGTRRGPNLFHSFDRFSVGTWETANFTSAQTGIKNILSRVTGGQRSDIDGQLRTDGQLRAEGADLYLLNPAGVLFGPNATPDVSGSFHVSTADYLRLADGARFSARLSETSTLSVAPPAAFGFLGPTPAAITTQGSTLQVPEGATLSVVGGEVQIVGGMLQAPGGRIQLASVATAGEVTPMTSGVESDLQVDSAARLGGITLSQNARVDASGNGGGTVRIRAGRLLVDQSTLVANNQGQRNGMGLGVDLATTVETVLTPGTTITANSQGAGRARDLRVTTGSLRMEGAVLGSTASQNGQAGSIEVQATQVALTGGARISSNTQGAGQGGTVRVTATDTLTLAGTSADGRVLSAIDAFGTGGSVIIEAPRVALTGGAQIHNLTAGPGQGGTVQVRATDTLTLAGTSADGRVPSGIFVNAIGIGAGAGSAGSIEVQAPRVALTGGAGISSNTQGAGQGGTVRVTATDTLTLADASSIQASALGTGAGAGSAGNVIIEAPRVALTGGAQISSSTDGLGHAGTVQVTATDTLTLAGTSADVRVRSGIFVNAIGIGAGAGSAGSVVVEAPRVSLTGGAQIQSLTAGSGQGGTVRVTATDTLTLADASGIQASASGTGAGAGSAGNVIIEAPRVALTGGAQISSGTRGPGQGGTIRVTAADTLALSGTSPDGTLVSGIVAIARGTGAGAGDAGAVIVEARTARIAEGAQISSSTLGPGHGGTITVTTADTLTIAGRNSGLRTTAAGSGMGGDITVDAHQVQLTDGAVITAESTGAGNAGSLTLTAHDTVLLRGHSTVTTAASQATGGNIRVTAASLVRLQDSQLSATVGGGTGDGGNVTIDPAFIVLQGSQITANAVAGRGGRVSLTASKAFLADPKSTVTASSTLGINGEVNIQAPVTNISGAVAPLKQAFAPTTELLRSRCVERLREGTVSRFIISGRDGVPLEPGSLLLSPLVRAEQPSPAPLAEPVAGQREVSFGPEGGLEMPTIEALSLRGTQAQARGPGVLDVECVRWRGM
jgi:filamentous hemagglutinin family protein